MGKSLVGPKTESCGIPDLKISREGTKCFLLLSPKLLSQVENTPLIPRSSFNKCCERHISVYSKYLFCSTRNDFFEFDIGELFQRGEALGKKRTHKVVCSDKSNLKSNFRVSLSIRCGISVIKFQTIEM